MSAWALANKGSPKLALRMPSSIILVKMLSNWRGAGAEEVRGQRGHVALGLDGAGGGDERLAGDLPAEDPLAVLVGLAAPEDVLLDLLEVEELDQLVEGRSHGLAAYPSISC
jgi:hypothetical protein